MNDYEIALLLKAVAEVVRMQAELVLIGNGVTPPGQHVAANHARVLMRETAYTPEQHTRIQLGLRAERPADDAKAFRLAITANLVATNAPQLRALCDDAIDEGRNVITVDLEDCPWIDARGFGILVAIANRANRRGGSVTIVHANEDLRALFVRHGIASLFVFVASLAGSQ